MKIYEKGIRVSIPTYQDFMLPLLKLVSKNKEIRLRDTYKILADEFNLTEEERKELIPSRSQIVYIGRIGWAKTYLLKAGLLESPQRGYVLITAKGLDLLKTNPEIINNDTLTNYDDFNKFYRPNKIKKAGTDKTIDISVDTPEEIIESAFNTINEKLEDELLNLLLKCSPSYFEQVVVDVLVAMGYGGSVKEAGEVLGKSGDEGIDGVIKEDRLGLDIIYIQAKRWGNSVGRPEIQKFVGALQGKRAKKGVFITTSTFTSGAVEYVGNIDSRVILIDGIELAKLMIEFDLGVSDKAVYKIKSIDTDYFTEE